MCVCAGYVCTALFSQYIYIYIYIFIYIYTYYTIAQSIMICDPVSLAQIAFRALETLANRPTLSVLRFFDSTLLESAGLASVCSSIGARLCQHPKGFCCTHIAPLHQYSADRISHDKSWLINRDGSSKRSRWRIESRCCMGCEPFMTF